MEENPPAEGESETKVVSGKSWKYCKTCKRWQTGKGVHTTSDHKKKSDLQPPQTQATLAITPIETSGLRMNASLFMAQMDPTPEVPRGDMLDICYEYSEPQNETTAKEENIPVDIIGDNTSLLVDSEEEDISVATTDDESLIFDVSWLGYRIASPDVQGGESQNEQIATKQNTTQAGFCFLT